MGNLCAMGNEVIELAEGEAFIIIIDCDGLGYLHCARLDYLLMRQRWETLYRRSHPDKDLRLSGCLLCEWNFMC